MSFRRRVGAGGATIPPLVSSKRTMTNGQSLFWHWYSARLRVPILFCSWQEDTLICPRSFPRRLQAAVHTIATNRGPRSQVSSRPELRSATVSRRGRPSENHHSGSGILLVCHRQIPTMRSTDLKCLQSLSLTRCEVRLTVGLRAIRAPAWTRCCTSGLQWFSLTAAAFSNPIYSVG